MSTGFREGVKSVKNITKFLLIPKYDVMENVARINGEIVEGVTQEMGQLTSFYLGVTNEWLETMSRHGGSKVGLHTGSLSQSFNIICH